LFICAGEVLLPQLRDRKLRPLGTPSSKRLADLPDVPTMAELGVPNFIASSWTGIVAPAGTPKAIVDKVNRAVNAALAFAGNPSQAATTRSASHVRHAAGLRRLPRRRTAEMDRDGKAVGCGSRLKTGINHRVLTLYACACLTTPGYASDPFCHDHPDRQLRQLRLQPRPLSR